MQGYWVGDRFVECRKSEWNKHKTDYDFIQTVIMLAFTVIMVLFAIAGIVVWANKTIRMNNYQIKESQKVNEQYRFLYESPANVDETLITKQQMEERKRLYEAEELEKQKKALLIAETKHAKTICEIGSYVWIKNYGGKYGIYVRVKDIFGYEGMTWEGINFNIADTDNWEYISFHNYYCQCIAQERPVYTSKYINFVNSGYTFADGTTK